MAYSNPLDPSTPSGSDPLAQGDDRLREAKGAIRERLATLVEDVDVDPLVPKAEVFGRPEVVTLLADTSVAESFGIALYTLALQVIGTTSSAGELVVDLDDVNAESDVEYNLAMCMVLLAQPAAPDHPAASPNAPVTRSDGDNEITLRVLGETEHEVTWNLLLVFRGAA